MTAARGALSLLAALAATFASSAALRADVLPPQRVEAEERLRQNPKAFDRVDRFCAGRAVGAACTIPGDALAGGGAGLCRNSITMPEGQIDLRCERSTKVEIDRGLPSTGFAVPPHVCQVPEGAEVARRLGFGCTPSPRPLEDRFCRGRAVGAACEVALRVDDRPLRSTGVCARVTESAPRFYFRGWHVAKRAVVQCVSAQPVQHEMKPLSWWQKVRQ